MSLKEFIFSINNAMTTQLGSDAITEVENMEPQPHHNTLDLDELESTVQTLLSPLDIWIDSPIPIMTIYVYLINLFYTKPNHRTKLNIE